MGRSRRPLRQRLWGRGVSSRSIAVRGTTARAAAQNPYPPKTKVFGGAGGFPCASPSPHDRSSPYNPQLRRPNPPAQGKSFWGCRGAFYKKPPCASPPPRADFYLRMISPGEAGKGRGREKRIRGWGAEEIGAPESSRRSEARKGLPQEPGESSSAASPEESLLR